MTIMEQKSDKEQCANDCDDVKVKPSNKNISQVKHKYILVSSKPGVGKSVVTVNLAIAFSKMNLSVGLVDANFNSPAINRLLSFQDELHLSSDSKIDPIIYSDLLKVMPVADVFKKYKSQKQQSMSSISDIIQWVSEMDWGRTDYLFFDTSAGPSDELREVIGSVPDAKVIIVTAPNKIDQKSFVEMTNFIRREDIHIWGWIENMRGFLCQNCDRRISTMGTGPAGRAIYLNEVPFLGRIPIDLNMEADLDKQTNLTEYPWNYETEPYDMIADKIIALNKKTINLSQKLEVESC